MILPGHGGFRMPGRKLNDCHMPYLGDVFADIPIAQDRFERYETYRIIRSRLSSKIANSA